MVAASWMVIAGVFLGAGAEKEPETVKLIQSSVVEIGGRSVGLIKIRSRESKVTGKPFYLAEIVASDPKTKEEQSYLVGEGNELDLGTRRVRVMEVRDGASEGERGHIIFELLTQS
jgi:hypothetical protein